MADPKAQNKFSEQYILNDAYVELLHALGVFQVGWNGQQGQVGNADNLRLEIEYDGNSNPIYIGAAAPGTLTSQAYWMIRKLTFDGNSNVTSIKYANGTPVFDQIYDNRAGLSYA